MIRNIKDHDIPAICKIYNHYIKNTIITFEEIAVEENEMAARVNKITTIFPFLVYEKDDIVIGYSYAGFWKERSAYRFTVEATIYLHPEFTGTGIGNLLYEQLFFELKGKEIHSVIAGISLPNAASIGLHEKHGFVKCGHFNQVGRKFDQWIDVGYWEKLL